MIRCDDPDAPGPARTLLLGPDLVAYPLQKVGARGLIRYVVGASFGLWVMDVDPNQEAPDAAG